MTTAKIGDRSVTAPKLAFGAVTATTLSSHSVGAGDLQPGAVTAGTLARGVVSAATLGDVVVRVATQSLPDNSSVVATAMCHAGEQLLSGGGRTGGSGPYFAMEASYPIDADGSVPEGTSAPPQGWQAVVHNGAGGVGNTFAVAYALCLK